MDRVKRDFLDQERRIEAMVAEENHLLDFFSADFEDRFRGSRTDIRERQRVYLPYSGGTLPKIVDRFSCPQDYALIGRKALR